MNGIKLPVTVSLVNDGDESFFVFLDADDNEIGATEGGMRRIAAALNAAPTRAFEELTAGAIAQMRSEICEAIGEYPSEGSDDDQAAWLEKADAAFLSRLQAFAAPQVPQWQPIETAPRDGTIIQLLRKNGAVFPGTWNKSTYRGRRFPWIFMDDAYSLNGAPIEEFTHWQPLPAAPEVRGGPDHG